jgi:holo-[acyl-carrier protein] synthase
MIVSIGVDIVEVYRIREAISRNQRFAERVFTPAERAQCEAKGVQAAASYAGRFAAKEAFLKGLKTGWRGKITWHDMEIITDESGAPTMRVTGEAAKLLSQFAVDRVHLSISHTNDNAIAQVLLESTGNPL